MRHIVLFDETTADWAVVDTQSSNLVISFHRTQGAAKAAAAREEQNWPYRQSGRAA